MAGRIDFSSVRRKSLSVAVLASSIAAFALPGGAGEAGSPSGTFLTLSDVHYDGNAQDVWGSQQETSRILWTRAQDESKRLVAEKNPGFVIYLGDLPAHNMDAGRRETQFRAVLDGLQSIVAGTGKRLIYVPGNNDSVAPDYCAFTEGGETPFDHASDPKAWPVVNSKPADFINRDNLAKGYYSVYPLGAPAGAGTSPNLRVVTLNSVIFNPNYGGFTGTCVSPSVRQDDANGQIEWLRGELQAARDAGHKVLIAMHVPPGVNGYGSWHNPDAIVTNWKRKLDYTGSDAKLAIYRGQWVQKVYLQLVAEYADEIVGTLSSHTHLNGIRRLRDCSGKMTELDLSIPAVTTDHGSNPALKLFSYDSGFELTGNNTHYASEATGKDWVPANVFSFADNYPCARCQSGDNLIKRVAALSSDALLGGMMKFLTVGRSQTNSLRHYKRALDVECELPPLSTIGN